MKAILYVSLAAASAFQHHQSLVSLQKKITSKTILQLRDGDEEDDVDNNSTPSYELGRRKIIASLAPLPFLLNTHDASAYIEETNQVNTSLSLPSSRLCADTAEESRIKIFEAVAPSVVYIDTFTEKRDVMDVPVGSGSGFIWDNSGHIVTNFHVIQSAQSANVAILTPGTSSTSTIKPQYSSVKPGAIGDGSSVLTNYKRTVYKARVVGIDPTKDIAVLKVDDVPIKDLKPISVTTSTGLRVGQGSLAIGNPFGLDHTLTSGIISGIGREVKSPIGRPISNVIQTDAAINPGNSGGPLLNSQGKLIGMATAIYSPSGASAGVGFAIPSDTVKFIVETLIENGQVVRPLLGITMLDSNQARQALGITKGILILDVKPGTPAAKSGLKGLKRSTNGMLEMGDIITQVESTTIEKEGDIFKAIEPFKPGDIIKVKINRPQFIDVEGTAQVLLKEKTFDIELVASDGLGSIKDEIADKSVLRLR